MRTLENGIHIPSVFCVSVFTMSLSAFMQSSGPSSSTAPTMTPSRQKMLAYLKDINHAFEIFEARYNFVVKKL